MKARPYTQTRAKKIKAHPPVDTVSRCRIGKGILKARADAVRMCRTLEDFYKFEGQGWLKYCKHAAKCDQCGAYEDMKHLDFINRVELQSKTKEQ